MEEKIDRAIEILAGKIVQSVKADDAMKYSQAALNLAHVLGVLAIEAHERAHETKDRNKTKGAGSQPVSRA